MCYSFVPVVSYFLLIYSRFGGDKIEAIWYLSLYIYLLSEEQT